MIDWPGSTTVATAFKLTQNVPRKSVSHDTTDENTIRPGCWVSSD